MQKMRKPPPNLLAFDWEALKTKLASSDANNGDYYMIVINKGQENEFRTRFMTHKEAMDTVNLAIEKKRLHFPIVL